MTQRAFFLLHVGSLREASEKVVRSSAIVAVAELEAEGDARESSAKSRPPKFKWASHLTGEFLIFISWSKTSSWERSLI